MFTALLSFLGGNVFRLMFGEVVSYLNKRQAHAMLLDAALLHSVVAADYAARWPDLTAPTLAECQSFVAGCALEC